MAEPAQSAWTTPPRPPSSANYARFGIEADFVEDPSGLEEWRSKVRPSPNLLFAESIPNPKNATHDLTGIAQMAHNDAGAPLIVDNTLATPYLCRPIEHGADIVRHDVVALQRLPAAAGAGDALDAHPTPDADDPGSGGGWLEEHELVESVDSSGLESRPYHRLARKYLPRGQGSVLAFTVRGGRESARTLINSVELISRMTDIGDVRTLIIDPATTTHGYLSQADRDRFGISDGLIRLSIGLEDAEDLIADLQQALRTITESHGAAA